MRGAGTCSLLFNLLVVIRDFHFVGPVVPPQEEDSTLIVDANAVLPLRLPFRGSSLFPGGIGRIMQYGRAILASGVFATQVAEGSPAAPAGFCQFSGMRGFPHCPSCGSLSDGNERR